MSESQHLAEALQGLLTRPDHGWFTPFAVAVAGLTAAQAATVPAPGFNSVWGVVNHMRFWHELTIARLRGTALDPEALWAEEGWPAPGDPADEEAWQAACTRAMAANAQLAELVAGLSDDELSQPVAPGRASRYQAIHGLIAHNSYHTCEIITIRHLQGLWLERT